LGAIFLSTALLWFIYAFLQSPIFDRRNFQKFAQQLFNIILRGSDSELPIIASELARSAKALVKYARSYDTNYHWKPNVTDYADDVLLLIGNRKFCRHLVAAAPGTAILFFEAMSDQKKYRIPIGQFAVNVSTEAFSIKIRFSITRMKGIVLDCLAI
jgi:hypothetical protein